MAGKRSLPLPFAGSEAILAAILVGETPALPGGELLRWQYFHLLKVTKNNG